MRILQVKAFSYHDLSEEAKRTAFEEWLYSAGSDYYWDCENREVLKRIKESIGEVLKDWSYDSVSHHYRLDEQDLQKITHAEGLWNSEANIEEYQGIRATKVAMRIYYDLTKKTKGYAIIGDDDSSRLMGKRISTYSEYVSNYQKKRYSKLETSESCFTGYCASDTFARALWKSITEYGAESEGFTVRDHLEAAFDALFDDFVADYAHYISQEYFDENVALEYEYNEDGSLFSVSEYEEAEDAA